MAEATVAAAAAAALVSFSAEARSAAHATALVAEAAGLSGKSFAAAHGPFAGFVYRGEKLLLPRKLGLDVPVQVSVPSHDTDVALAFQFPHVFV